MTDDVLSFVRTELPSRFTKGVSDLSVQGADVTDIRGARGAFRIVARGAGEVFLVVENGGMTAADTAPAGVPVRAAIEFAAEDAQEALGLLRGSGHLEDPEAPARFAKMFSARVEKMVEGHKLEFHFILKAVPNHDDVTIRIGIGTDTPPEKPQFTAALRYSDLEDLRERSLQPQQVIGRLRLTGDASRAMALGMMLMQPPKK